MNVINKTIIFLIICSFFNIHSVLAASCPNAKQLEILINKTFHKNLKIVKVTQSEIKGICAVEVKLGTLLRIIYVDSKARYLLTGKIYDIKTGENLTQKQLGDLNKLTPKELKTLDKYVAFTFGKKGTPIYFVSDPICPYCRKAEKVVKEMAEKGIIKAHYVLYPLSFHPGAYERCVSIICEHKGIKAYETGNIPSNQCKEGQKWIDKSKEFLNSKGIYGTPTYIFLDGRHYTGFLTEKQLIEMAHIKVRKKFHTPHKLP